MNDNTLSSWLITPVCGDFEMDYNETLLELSDGFCVDTCAECNRESFDILENNVSQLQAWTLPQKVNFISIFILLHTEVKSSVFIGR